MHVATTDPADDTPTAEDAPDVKVHEPDEPPIDEHPTSEAHQSRNEAIPESDDDDSDHRFWKELDLLAKITETSDELTSVAEEIESHEQTIKDAKEGIKQSEDLEKGLSIRLRRLAAELSDVRAGRPLPKDPNAETEPEAEPEDDNAWRELKTEDLVKGVSGLGGTKLEKLLDVAPTAGQLEDLRAQASLENDEFHKVLPSGIGRSIADQIESRLVDAVTKHDTPSAEDQLEEGNGEEESDSEEANESDASS
jgi:hypothetical protein